ncbi:MAG: hypothetical protein CME62_05320 [Halobacteriovoraceae bacterium]|nr:hypothetical protein [Halobacteriovoraceae bacterium]
MSLKKTKSKNKKTMKVLIILMLALAVAMSSIIYSAFFSFDRQFTILFNKKYNFCYLISNDYTYEVKPDELIYRGMKNEGRVKLQLDGFSEDVFFTESLLNHFKFGYKKIKNFRIREYEVSEGIVLKDTFEMIEKTPEPLVPEKKRCELFLENYPRKVEIFTGL